MLFKQVIYIFEPKNVYVSYLADEDAVDERFLGVDIGGTSIKWTVLRGRRIENRGQLPTPRVDHHAVLRVVAELSRGVGGQLCGIGVAVPGTVDPVRRRSIFVPNLPGDWADLHVAEELEGITGLPVVLINDARAFAWAEHTSGAARGVANALFITLGTGVGGAIAFRGEILVGDIDAIGEVGHVPVDPDGYLCACVSVCTDEAWDEVLRVDLTSAFSFVRACLNNCAPGASVVLIGSALAKGLDGDFLTAAYRVAKAGMVPLLEAAAYEGARKGIRVNIVAPGLVETRMAARALGNEEIIARFPELMPLTRRPSTADEVAAAVRWLVGCSSVQTTGAVIPVDGGWLLR